MGATFPCAIMAKNTRQSDRVSGQAPALAPAENPESILCRSAILTQLSQQQPQDQPTDANSTATHNTAQWRQNNPSLIPSAFNSVNTPTYCHIHKPMFNQPPTTPGTVIANQTIANQSAPNIPSCAGITSYSSNPATGTFLRN